MYYWRRMEKTKWSKNVTNEALQRIGVTGMLLNNILCEKAYWIEHILKINYLLYDAIEGQMTEVKVIGGRRSELLDDQKNRRRY